MATITPGQIMLADIILTKIITLGGLLARVKEMSDEQVEAAIVLADDKLAEQIDRLNQH